MERIPKSGELYRHFKDKLYQIVTVAIHSETGEKLVIYQALYGEYRIYARPLSMFISEVDHVKYPEVTQKYRFERVEPVTGSTAQQNFSGVQKVSEMSQSGGQSELAQETGTAAAECETADGYVNPKLLAFLDAESMEEKYDVLRSLRDEITDELINSLAVSIDVVIPEGRLEERYEALKNCVRTRRRYESDRLR